MDIEQDQPLMQEQPLPKNPFKVQQPRPVQSVQPRPQPIQSTQVRAGEQMRDQLRKQEQTPIQDVEAKESSGMGENPPDDWLTPKIYKGSTNF